MIPAFVDTYHHPGIQVTVSLLPHFCLNHWLLLWSMLSNLPLFSLSSRHSYSLPIETRVAVHLEGGRKKQPVGTGSDITFCDFESGFFPFLIFF